jgi:hypothetical protein
MRRSQRVHGGAGHGLAPIEKLVVEHAAIPALVVDEDDRAAVSSENLSSSSPPNRSIIFSGSPESARRVGQAGTRSLTREQPKPEQ